MDIKTKYDIKQMVYLVHDPEQQKRMITEIVIVTPKLHMYILSCGDSESEHYEYELSAEPDVTLKTSN